uniref:Uncharacterized protein n=1 Tax=Magallana gigas TaxID=29159 RepID=A0A8W8MB69_MAGGI
MLRWLKTAAVKPGLPDPQKANTPEKKNLIENVNESVEKEMLTCSPSSPSGSRKRKRGNYERFSPETKAKIARYAINHGASKAARYYSTTLNKNVQESTVQRFKTAYLLESKRNDGSPITALTPQKRGRPPLLGNLDEDVQDYIKDLRISGGIINTNIVRCIGRGVFLHKDKFQLEEFGGPMTSEKILFVFDFDHTVIDDDSDLYCKRLAPGGKIPHEIEKTYSDLGWTHYMGLIFDYLHKHGVTEKQYRECMNEIPLRDGMRELIEHDWCDLSTVNLYKGQIVVDHKEKREREGTQYKCVVLVGDRNNDFCPALRLSEKDVVCPRINYRLWKKIQKLKSESEDGNDGLKIQAQVVNWTSGLEILEFLKTLN